MADTKVDLSRKHRDSFNEILALSVIEKLKERNINGFWTPSLDAARMMTLSMMISRQEWIPRSNPSL